MTIRDIDCADFDVEDCLAHFKRWRVTLFSFFAGGYVTTYPTKLNWQKVSPYLAEGRDLCGEIITAAHRAGMIAFPMIDLGELPEDLANAHPDWAAQKADGSFYVKTDGIIVSCALGAYRREKCRELAREMKDRYGDELDGLKWGGASYGAAPGVDHNPIAAERWKKDAGRPLPEDFQDPQYQAWREDVIRETAGYLRKVVHEEAGVPTVGNSVWHLGGGAGMEDLAAEQDFTQVEVQTRTHPVPDGMDASWQRFDTPIETTRYVSLAAQRPPWVVASYFLAWPWRRVAVPVAEQFLYLAQVAANGGNPMVNLTTGAPQHHDDPRGFEAIDRLYNFIARNEACYDNDESAAGVAIIYHHASARAAGESGDRHRDYLDEFQAWETALDRRHIPYDVASLRLIREKALRYQVIVVPAPLALTEAEARQLAEFRRAGGGLVLSGRVGTFSGAELPTDLQEELLGGAPAGERQPFTVSQQQGLAQAYLSRKDPAHPLCAGIDCALMAAAGHWIPMRASAETTAPITRAAPFRLFPEGISYTNEPHPDNPLALCGESSGRRVYFAFDAGRCYRRAPHPDNEQLLVNAVLWAGQAPPQLECLGFPDLRISVRKNAAGHAIHFINTAGRDRYRTEFTPVREVTFTWGCDEPKAVRHGAAGEPIPFAWEDGRLTATLPEIESYTLVQIEH